MNIFKNLASNKKSLYAALLLILFIVLTTVGVMLIVSKNDKPKTINNDKSSETETIAKEEESKILNDEPPVEATPQPQETQKIEYPIFDRSEMFKSEKFYTVSDTVEVEIVTSFNLALSGKDFETAYAIGPQGRSYDTFVNLYKDVETMVVQNIEVIGKNTVTANVVIVDNGVFKAYDVTYAVDTKSKTIVSSEVSEVIGIELDCQKYIILPSIHETNTESRLTDACVFRHPTTHKVLSVHHTIYIFLKPTKLDGNVQYLAMWDGDGGVELAYIYSYNIETKEIGYMGEYVRKNYPIMDIEGCNEYIIESYIEGGCLSDFSNEDWFKMNYNYLQAGQKYSEGGVNMNTSIGKW